MRQLHKCKCNKCTEEQPLACRWREKALKFIDDHFGSSFISEEVCKLTYVQTLELAGLPGPSSARERNLLNLISYLPQCSPMRETLAVLDITQAVDYVCVKVDGTVPTGATNTVYWSMRHGRKLSTSGMGALMGHDMPGFRLPNDLSESQFRGLLGNGLHTAAIGVSMCGAIAAIAGPSRP